MAGKPAQKRSSAESSAEASKDAKHKLLPNSAGSSNSSSEASKRQRRDQSPATISAFALNPALTSGEFRTAFRAAWAESVRSDDTGPVPQAESSQFPASDVLLHRSPFTLAICSRFLAEPALIAPLCSEMQLQPWRHECLDLFSLYQTRDLANFTDPSSPLHQFHALLDTQVRPLLQQLTGLQLTAVSASCSMYTPGDHLLPHDDRRGDRRIAYVFYVSPWPKALTWTAAMGGALEMLATSAASGHRQPVLPCVRSIAPSNNQFVFFRVGQRSYHQVAEVETLDYPRLTINGWFHGPDPAAAAAAATDAADTELVELAELRAPNTADTTPLSDHIHSVYLRPQTAAAIQKRVERRSEAALVSFFEPAFFAAVRSQLLAIGDDQWQTAGPADHRHFDRLPTASAAAASGSPLGAMCTLMRSAVFFQLLHAYTELDLAGKQAQQPAASLEIWRIGRGSYSLLGAADPQTQMAGLDAMVFFNARDAEPGGSVGRVHYLPPAEAEADADAGSERGSEADSAEDSEDGDEGGEDDDEEEEERIDESGMLEVTPKDNSLNLVYRTEGTTKYLKYVSKRTRAIGDYVFMLVAYYRE